MPCQVFNITMHVTKVDERAWVCEFSFHQEVFYSFRIVEGCFFYNSLNFFEVTKSSACLDVFEVNVGVICLRQNIAKEQQQTLVCAELFKYLNSFLSVYLVCILNSNLGDQSCVLAICAHKVIHTHERVILRKFIKELDHDFFWNCMRVKHNAMSILNVLSVLEGSSVESHLFAEFCDSFTIKMSEKIKLEDTLGNLGSRHQVNF